MPDTTELATADVTGVILCGGRASRLGGVDKGLYEVLGRPLVDHVIARLAPQVSSIVINANRNLDVYRKYGLPVVTDRNSNFDGPLAGVLAAMQICETPWMVTIPCDAPRFPQTLVDHLRNSACSADAEVCCVHDGVRLQPTFCLYRPSVKIDLETYLDHGNRKMDRFLEGLRFVTAPFGGDVDAFLNLNSSEDFASFDTNIRTHAKNP